MADAPASAPLEKTILSDALDAANTWRICGAFPKEGCAPLERDWLRGALEEKDIRALLGRKYAAKGGRAAWVRQPVEVIQASSADPATGQIRLLKMQGLDFLKAFREDSIDSSVYALAVIESPADVRRTIMSGSDDGMTIWLNGREILAVDRSRPLVPDEDLTIGSFRKGLNVILVRVNNSAGYWGMSMRFVSAKGVLSPALPDMLPDSLLSTR